MSIVRRRWPAVSQFWFDEPIPVKSVDVAHFKQRSSAPPGAKFGYFHTLLIDLAGTEEQILSSFNKETRYEIKRAQTRDSFACLPVSNPDDARIREFHKFYGLFASGMGLDAVGLEYLIAASRSGHLRLSSIACREHTLVWHSYIASASRARLLHSASVLRQQDSSQGALIGRANRLLHWLDMLEFKRCGLNIYDFGGWFHGRDTEGRPKTNLFKAGFGGTRVTEYDGVVARSTLGRIYLWLRSKTG